MIKSIVNYLVTIRCQQVKNKVKKRDLKKVQDWIILSNDNIVFEDYADERDTYGSLHRHAIVSVPRGFRYKAFTQFGDTEHMYNTYRIHWKPIKAGSKGAVKKYIHKSSIPRQISEIYRESQTRYMFID